MGAHVRELVQKQSYWFIIEGPRRRKGKGITTMRALVLDGGVALKEVPMPKRAPGEALIRVLTAGICNTDIELQKGYMHFSGILGHEFVGMVEDCDNPALKGKRVVGEINCVCHRCAYCQMEMPHHCLDRTVLGIQNRNGAFAEYLTLPEENLHLAPNSIRDDVVVFAEPTAAAFRITEQIPVANNDQIVVLGDGKLGQLVAQVLWNYSKNLVCVGRHAWKLDLLRSSGIPVALQSEPIERGADIVVDCTGSPGGFPRALELVRPEGTIILKTTVAQPTAIELSIPVVDEVRILGSRCGPFRPALEALTLGTVNVTPMITESYPLSDAVQALKRAEAPDVMKVLLHM